MSNRQAIHLIVLALLGILVVLGVHEFFEAHVVAQPIHVAQSSSVGTLQNHSSKLAEGGQSSSENEQSLCKKALSKDSEEVIGGNAQEMRESFYQTRDRYMRTRDFDDLECALKFAGSVSKMYGKSSNIAPQSLKNLSLSLDVVQWLEEAQKQLKKEIWVPTIEKEKDATKNYLKGWVDDTKGQINDILTPNKISQLQTTQGIGSVYIQLNAARSLIRLITNDSIRSALGFTENPDATLACQSPSWQSTTCVNLLLKGALDKAFAETKNPLEPNYLLAKAYAQGFIGQWYEKASKMPHNISANKASSATPLKEDISFSRSCLDQDHEVHLSANSKENLSRAQYCTQKALEITSSISEKIDAAYQDYQWQWQLGRIHQLNGKDQDAILAYDTAVQTLNTIRNNLVSAPSRTQFSFRDDVSPVYREYVGLLLGSDGDEQQKQANIKKARDLIESLQLAELKNFLKCEIKLTKTAEELTNEDRSAAIIYPIILEDRLEVIISIPEEGSRRSLKHYSASLLKEELKEQNFKTFQEKFEAVLKELRYSLEQPYISEEGRKASRQIYNWLIRPAEEFIVPAEQQKSLGSNKVPIKTLLFIPDGALRSIPMAALYNGEEYLVQKYAIAVSPRLQLLVDKPRKSHKALIAGLTKVEHSEEGFSSLKYAEKEVQAVKSIVGNSEILIGENFNKDSLEKALKSSDYNIVHLATHGEFNFQQDQFQQNQTFIVSGSGRVYFKDLQSLFEANNNVLDLLVLSACETASGDDRDTLGIAGMTVRTGARSAIASLWNIDDPATAKLIEVFYTELINKRKTKAEALRQAMLSLLTDKSNIYKPSQWAPYLLVGDWR